MQSPCEKAFDEHAREIVEELAKSGRPCSFATLRALFDIAFVAGESHGLETAQEITNGIRKYVGAA